MSVHVWDMDGVLNTGNCFFAYLNHRLGTSPLRLARALPILVRHKLARSYEARAQCGHAIVRSALRGLSMDDYRQQAMAFGQHLAHQPGFVRAEAVAHLNALHAHGTQIVIATACERTLAAAFLAAAGVWYHALSATEFTDETGTITVANARDGIRKADALTALGINLGEAHFVTDSYDDFPTAFRCRDVLLVNPSDEDAHKYAASGLTFDTATWS